MCHYLGDKYAFGLQEHALPWFISFFQRSIIFSRQKNLYKNSMDAIIGFIGIQINRSYISARYTVRIRITVPICSVSYKSSQVFL